MFFKQTDRNELYRLRGVANHLAFSLGTITGKLAELESKLDNLGVQMNVNHELLRCKFADLERTIREKQFTTVEIATKPEKRKARKT